MFSYLLIHTFSSLWVNTKFLKYFEFSIKRHWKLHRIFPIKMSCYVNCYANSMTILILSVPCGLIIIIWIMSNTMMDLENARKIQPVHLDATRIKLIHLFFIRNLNFGWALMFLSHSLISVLECSYQSLIWVPGTMCSVFPWQLSADDPWPPFQPR